MSVLDEINKKENENKIEENQPKEDKKEGFIFKSKLPNLYLYSLKIRFIKGEYATTDEKEAKNLRKIKGIEEVTQK